MIETGGAVKKIKQGHYFCVSHTRWLVSRGPKICTHSAKLMRIRGHKSKPFACDEIKGGAAQLQSTLGGWATNLNLQAIFGQFHSARVHLGLSYRWRSGCFAFSAHLFAEAAGGRAGVPQQAQVQLVMCLFRRRTSGPSGAAPGCTGAHHCPRSFDARPRRESRRSSPRAALPDLRHVLFSVFFALSRQSPCARRFVRAWIGGTLALRESSLYKSCSQGPDKRDLVVRLCASARNGEIDAVALAVDFDNIVASRQCVKKTRFPLVEPRGTGVKFSHRFKWSTSSLDGSLFSLRSDILRLIHLMRLLLILVFQIKISCFILMDPKMDMNLLILSLTWFSYF